MTAQEKIDKGYIYVLWNEVYQYYGDNVYKIGRSNNIEHRLRSYTTSYVDSSIIKYSSVQINNHPIIEKIIHNELDMYRIKQNREFFKVELSTIINTIINVINTYGNKPDVNYVFDTSKNKSDIFNYEEMKTVTREFTLKEQTMINVYNARLAFNTEDESILNNNNLFLSFVVLQYLCRYNTIQEIMNISPDILSGYMYDNWSNTYILSREHLLGLFSRIYCILDILKELGYTTIKETVNIRMNWNTLATIFKKEETVTLLNKSGKMSTEFRECPVDIDGITNIKEKSKWKKGLILSLNKKLSQLLGLTLVREQNSTKSPNYENFHIEIDEYFKCFL